ncbi:MAG: DUF3341 domain-containing protein [candidate division Zixibacteria bacterium]|nr:DUF3341 domain-containing protein [candidate division Zixibacteria bacterium]
MSAVTGRVTAVIAQFDTPADLLHAAEKVRDAGYKQFDCHSPFPIHGMDRAMGEKRSPLGYIVGAVALVAFSAMTYFIYWVTTSGYRMVISGKPDFSYQAFAPVVFAVTVLASAIAATFGMMILNRLPQLWHPLFESGSFRKFSDDGFIVSLHADDPKFDPQSAADFLKRIGGKNVETVEVTA